MAEPTYTAHETRAAIARVEEERARLLAEGTWGPEVIAGKDSTLAYLREKLEIREAADSGYQREAARLIAESARQAKAGHRAPGSSYWVDGVGRTLAQVDLNPRRSATYTMTREGAQLTAPHAEDLATDMLTAMAAVDEIRDDGALPLSETSLCDYLGAVRRAAAALAAVQDELILMAREPDWDGQTVTWRTLGDAMDGTHLTTVRERHTRLIDGRTHSWRRWLTGGTKRAPLYPAGVRKVGEPMAPGTCEACGGRNLAESLTGPESLCQDCGHTVAGPPRVAPSPGRDTTPHTIEYAGGSATVPWVPDLSTWWWIGQAADGTSGEAPEDARYRTRDEADDAAREWLSATRDRAASRPRADRRQR